MIRSVDLKWLCFVIGGFAASIHSQQIPDLNWVERSDWINVKSDVSPGAAGDGVADDAMVIQNIFTTKRDAYSHPLGVIYFPPGTYRITQSITLPGSDGLAIVGHGRGTVVKWDGAAGSPMFISYGAVMSCINGITFDGTGKASAGILLNAHDFFECQIRYENCAFVRCGSGIRSMSYADWQAGKLAYATSETEYVNCLFDSLDYGVSLLFFNYFNHIVTGCEFKRVKNPLYTEWYGQIYANACRFDNSSGAICSFGSGSQGQSVRNSIASGSAGLFTSGYNYAAQNCYIDKTLSIDASNVALLSDISTTNSGAVALAGNGAKVPWSNCVANNAAASPTGSSNISEIPLNLRQKTGPALKRDFHFLKSSAPMPDRLFNVKDFGYNGAGLQKALDSAAAYTAVNPGKRATVYVPMVVNDVGGIGISSPVTVHGSNITLSGASMQRSQISPSGFAGGEGMIVVTDAKNVAIENCIVRNYSSYNGPMILVKGSASIAQNIRIDRIRMEPNGWSQLTTDPLNMGIVINNLDGNDTVAIGRVNLSVKVINSGDGIVCANFIDAPFYVEGTDLGGFVGVNVINGNIIVKNNHPFVVGDFYHEQSNTGTWGWIGSQMNIVTVEGGPADPPGVVTIGCTKMHALDTDSLFRLRSFRGNFGCIRGRFDLGEVQGSPGAVGYRAISTGNSHCTMVFMANAYQGSATRLQLQPGPNDTLVVIECDAKANVIPATGLKRAAEHLDNLARLSEVFLSLNFPGSIEGTATDVPLVRDRSQAWNGSITRQGTMLRIQCRGKCAIRIISLLGKELFAASGRDRVSIDLARLVPPGTYVVKVNEANHSPVVNAISLR